ncbi:MAG: hypothetical protein E6F95_03805 [Actinobacteria bacterium]|nr:MAG: hypothetical protein E6F95_03805 [Actinomycetota bacterium]
MSEPIIYIDRSNTREGKLEEVKAALPRLVEFVDAHEPQLLAYGMYLDPEGMSMTVTAIHPDTTSLELHLAVGGQEFRRFAGLIDLRSIEVFGRPSDAALEELQRKAAALGEGGTVTVHERVAGFFLR